MSKKRKQRHNPPVPITGTSSRSIVLRGEQFFGPLPPPSILEHYEKVHPGASEIIFENFKAQAKHRQELEKRVINGGIHDSMWGLRFGFMVVVITMVSATIIVLNGHSVTGGLFGIGGLSSLVGTFIYGSKQKRQEREEKQKIMHSQSLR